MDKRSSVVPSYRIKFKNNEIEIFKGSIVIKSNKVNVKGKIIDASKKDTSK